MDKVTMVKSMVADQGRMIARKAKDLSEITRLKSQIFTCEEVIRKNTLEIGQMVYAAYEEGKESEESGEETSFDKNVLRSYEKQCMAIENAKKAIADLKAQIREIKAKGKNE